LLAEVPEWISMLGAFDLRISPGCKNDQTRAVAQLQSSQMLDLVPTTPGQQVSRRVHASWVTDVSANLDS
jgi:hypothetical protein